MSYVTEALGVAEELCNGWTEQDWISILPRFSEMTREDWEAYRSSHVSEIASFVSSTPKERSAKKKWSADRPLLTIAAMQHCIAAYELLDLVQRHCTGRSYRQMTAQAGSVHRSIQASLSAYCPHDRLSYDARDLLSRALHLLKRE